MRDRKVDAVGGRAVDGEHALGDRLQTQRPAQRQRMTNGAGLFDRRDNRHLAERRKRLGERTKAFRSIPIVVGDENTARHRTIIGR